MNAQRTRALDSTPSPLLFASRYGKNVNEKWEECVSAVGFAAVFYGSDADGISVVMKTHAVVTDAHPELRRFNVLETLDIAFASFQVAGQRVQNAESAGLIDGTELGPCSGRSR